MPPKTLKPLSVADYTFLEKAFGKDGKKNAPAACPVGEHHRAQWLAQQGYVERKDVGKGQAAPQKPGTMKLLVDLASAPRSNDADHAQPQPRGTSTGEPTTRASVGSIDPEKFKEFFDKIFEEQENKIEEVKKRADAIIADAVKQAGGLDKLSEDAWDNIVSQRKAIKNATLVALRDVLLAADAKPDAAPFKSIIKGLQTGINAKI